MQKTGDQILWSRDQGVAMVFCGVKVSERASRLQLTGPARAAHRKFLLLLPIRIKSTLTNSTPGASEQARLA